jgi:hypothetical protein
MKECKDQFAFAMQCPNTQTTRISRRIKHLAMNFFEAKFAKKPWE